MAEGHEVIAAAGTTPDRRPWTLLYHPCRGQHSLRLLLDGREHESAAGFDIPEVTEIGFAGGLTAGRGHYFLFGLVTSRVHVVRAETHGHDPLRWSEVVTSALATATARDGSSLRTFVLVRQPVSDVSALVGLDQAGQVVQRIVI